MGLKYLSFCIGQRNPSYCSPLSSCSSGIKGVCKQNRSKNSAGQQDSSYADVDGSFLGTLGEVMAFDESPEHQETVSPASQSGHPLHTLSSISLDAPKLRRRHEPSVNQKTLVSQLTPCKSSAKKPYPSPEALSRELREEELVIIAAQSLGWEDEARGLGLTEGEISCIQKHQCDPEGHKIAMIRKWRDKMARKATLKELTVVSRRNKWHKLIEDVYGKLGYSVGQSK